MKAVICGAGITGLALAHRLAADDWEVVVIEKAPGPRTQGYMIDFFGAGYDAIDKMGLLPRLIERGYHVEEARFVDGNGRRRARLSFARFARTLDGRLSSVMRPDLELTLRESLPPRVRLRYGTSFTHVVDGADGVRVTLTGGEMLDADLLVGADGIHSAVRATVFGDERKFLRYLGFHTAAYTFHDPAIRDLLGNRFCLTDSVDRQVGMYGLRDGRVAVFTVHRAADPALPADPRAALLAEYGSLGWVVPEVLAQCPPEGEIYYDQVAQIEMPSWRRGRVVLAGDACHAVSLIAGQGASLGIAGAYLLADRLRHASTIEDGLAQYERKWRPIVTEKQHAARTGARWFLPRSPAQLHLRRIALALSRLPGFDHVLARTVGGKPTAIITELQSGRRVASGSGESAA